MQCPICQFENRKRAKFCKECGHNFEFIYSRCYTRASDHSKFCDECGANLIPFLNQPCENSGAKSQSFGSFAKRPLDEDVPGSLFNKFIKIYNKSDIIFEEGSFGNEMFIIRTGKIRIYTIKDGRQIVLRTCGKGEIFGEMALVDDKPRAASAISEENNTQLIAVDHSKFLYLVNQQPPFALTIMHILCERIRVSEPELPTN
jgi:hypothetical protein